MKPLSEDLDDPHAQPYFIWDVPITVRELKDILAGEDDATTALWTARVMREARYPDVWRFLTLDQVVRRHSRAERHLGRRRRFWKFLLEGWRADGLLP
ncbi:MAG: hypothetical protein HZB39_10110 [Planctomycetes bacterium]|nr:hypothetical protein [Planctomycetota bacterium]